MVNETDQSKDKPTTDTIIKERTPTLNLFSHQSTKAVIAHVLASQDDRPNAFGAKIPVLTELNIPKWRSYLTDYIDKDIVEFLQYGWPINYVTDRVPQSSIINHKSADSYSDHVQHYLDTELGFGAIAGPFVANPLHQVLTTSPLQTVPKRGSTKRRVVMDLSFPYNASVNDGISTNTYLDMDFKLHLPGIHRLRADFRKRRL